MSISLSKFTVPLSAGNGADQGIMMPKLKYRFRVEFTGFGGPSGSAVELTKQVMNVTRPGVQFDNVELHVYNSKINYAGRYTWADVTLVVRDDSTGRVSQSVGSQIQKQFDFMEQASASSAGDYKFATKIQILDGNNGTDPTVIEEFLLEGCYLQNTVYSNSDYSSSDPLDITMTIKYDNAVQTAGLGGVGLGGQFGKAINSLATGG